MTDSAKFKLISRRLINPERAMYFLPISIGVSISIISSIIFIPPMLLKKAEMFETLEEYKIKVSQLDELEEQYKIIKKNLQRALLQKRDLLKLVAGHSELKTLLSRINTMADLNKIKILELVPQPIEYNIPLPNSSGGTPPIDNFKLDPFLVENIIKYSYEIKLEGYFSDLIALFRDFEELEVIALNSSINISKNNQSDGNYSKDLADKIKVSFIISAYGVSN